MESSHLSISGSNQTVLGHRCPSGIAYGVWFPD
jgi:hypothetical protein